MIRELIIDKSFLYRHKLIRALYEDWEKNKTEEIRIMGSVQLSIKTNIPIQEVHICLYSMADKNEVTIANNDGQYKVSIQQPGISTATLHKYLKDGVKEKLDSVFDWARIILPLGALVLSIVNYYSNGDIKKRLLIIEQNELKKTYKK